MRWEGNRQSRNVEDRRGAGGRRGGLNLGIGSIIVAVVAGWIFGVNPLTILGLMQGLPSPQVQQAPAPAPGPDDRSSQFAKVVLADTEDVWNSIYRNYQEPRMVLFRGATPTSCGMGQSATGPFYCPADQTIYLDLSFFDELKHRLGAPGEFAQAYVIAHEVGHHLQRLQGTTHKLERLRGQISQAEYNQLSVRLELQADCYAGVWGHHADRQRQILENGDIEAAMNAAARIGDDALQRGAGRVVRPESFTHGSSAQRQRWFHIGLKTGDPNACDTFNAQQL
ncbi:metalloprotease [Vandammella animalimorsus]|uniref:Metalloprotease n=1 Tax=Vandammella animalimorsus TaxID=2029117 RepID=A0A2A2T2P6_9BURK|nr:neutral zinc metallopeptidase [Vandammella animalimorsus]PAT32321.1 metalloprotease [Vandammella animalimorsus]PAX15794.1 metalloprotease [Vandammella animalimorsus]PAX19678.1 metalloprotease [Vandammella animalimorsus]